MLPKLKYELLLGMFVRGRTSWRGDSHELE